MPHSLLCNSDRMPGQDQGCEPTECEVVPSLAVFKGKLHEVCAKYKVLKADSGADMVVEIEEVFVKAVRPAHPLENVGL